MTDHHLTLSVIGMGPRGLSVLERLIARLTAAQESRPVRVFALDPYEMGVGRIWRTDQSEWLLMNTPAGEVSLYSGSPDDGPWRAGAGPSLHEWLLCRPGTDADLASANAYAPRRVYGEYLRDVYDRITANLPPGVTVIPVRARARSLRRGGVGAYHLTTSDGRTLAVHKAVLTTGHPHTMAGDADRDLLDFASRHRGARHLRGGSAADMDLDFVPAGKPVAILGLGLTFYDIASALTTGRGGRFLEDPDGGLAYAPSGDEPRIVAGSRSGLPLLARGRNQKEGGYRYTPRFFTTQALAEARRSVLAESGHVQLGFRRHVLPLMLREVEHVYYSTYVRRRDGEQAAEAFAARHADVAGDAGEMSKLLAEAGLADVPPIDLEAMARPFAGEPFASPGAFHSRLLRVLRADVTEADQGNVDGPLKAALDILRDIRGVVRDAVEFSGLHPDSHRDEFLGWFNPINAMLSAGPPAPRIRQVIALIEAGVLTVVGPALRIGTDEDSGHYLLSSPQVAGSEVAASTLVDARLPRPDVRLDASPLTRQLIGDGLATTHVNINARDGARFTTGALAVTGKPFRLVDAAGRPSRDLYALGIPTEELRWFTQIGNGRPGPMLSFHTDADAIAADVLGTSPGPAAQAVTTHRTEPAPPVAELPESLAAGR